MHWRKKGFEISVTGFSFWYTKWKRNWGRIDTTIHLTTNTILLHLLQPSIVLILILENLLWGHETSHGNTAQWWKYCWRGFAGSSRVSVTVKFEAIIFSGSIQEMEWKLFSKWDCEIFLECDKHFSVGKSVPLPPSHPFFWHPKYYWHW